MYIIERERATQSEVELKVADLGYPFGWGGRASPNSNFRSLTLTLILTTLSLNPKS